MKNTLIFFALVIFLSSCASKASFNTFYKENKSTSVFSLNSPAFLAKMFVSKDDLEEFRPLFKSVKHFKILVFDDGENLMDRKFKKFIKKQDYETLLKIVDQGTNVQLYLSNTIDQKKEIILKVKDDKSYILIGLRTNMSDTDLDKILENINIKTEEISYN